MSANPSPSLHVQSLIADLNQRVNQLADQIKGEGRQMSPPSLVSLLKAALKNEWETAVLSCQWVCTESDPVFAMNLTRLAGDEAKHFLLISDLLKSRNEALPALDELNQRTPLYNHLLNYKTTFDRVTAGPFVREALAVARNRVFLNYCESTKLSESDDVLKVYIEIQRDEEHHHQLGLKLLDRLIKNDADLSRAKEIMSDTLKVVDDLQEMVMMKKGLCHLPGC